MPQRQRAPWRRIAATALAAAIVMVTPVAANAAPPYTTEATITGLEFTQQSTQSGSLTQLSGTWELPDHAAGPAGFSVMLPEDLQGQVSTFPILDPDGATIGECSVTATTLSCDVDDAYLAAHPLDVHGTFAFWVRVTTTVETTTEVDYAIGELTVPIEVQPGGGEPCTTSCEFTGQSAGKGGWFVPEDSSAVWVVSVPSPEQGMTAGQQVRVEDTIGAQQTIIPGATTVQATNQLGQNGRGETRPTGWAELPADAYTVSADGSVATFTAEEGFFYRVVYRATVDDGGAMERYSNEATITVEGVSSDAVTGSFRTFGGSATGIGTDVGVFTIAKDVTGDVPGLDGLTFTGTYVASTPEGETIEGSFEVVDGETWRSPELPTGSTVTLTETTPTEPASVDWAAPAFSSETFVLVGGEVTPVTLTNHATLATGSFVAAKVVEGDGADLVDPDATFVLEYAYPAGEHFAAGSGTLELPADGTQVESPQLPVGAIVTLVEQTPASIDGAAWAAPQLSQSTITIGRDEQVLVTLTNTITPVSPAPSTTPEPSAAPAPSPTSSLPVTGGEWPAGLLAGGSLLLAIGLLAASLRRGRR